MSECEWNPTLDEPAVLWGLQRDTDCPNEATLAVGRTDVHHLCDSCAALPRFARRSKRPLRSPGR